MKRLILKLLIFSFFGITKKAYCDDLDEEISLRIGINLKKTIE